MLCLITAASAAAESHPSWWGYASPEATALVGIQWDAVRQSPFADAIATELSSAGSLGFPDFDCLKQARQILISSPALLAIEVGNFPAAALQAEAAKKSYRRINYRTIPIWIPPAGARELGVAQIDEQLVLVGSRKTLESAIDRSANDNRHYSPLLAQAAHFSGTRDIWVVARRLPDPLANVFVPLDVQTLGFEGGVSIQAGLEAEASFDAVSPDVAAAIAEGLRQEAPSLPAIARDMRVAADGIRVAIEIHVTPERLAAELRGAPPAPETSPVVQVATAPPITSAAPVTPAPPAAPAQVAAVEPPKPAGPQVIRIFGLDDGPREIVLPDLPANQ